MPNFQNFVEWLEAKQTGVNHRQFLLLSMPLSEAMRYLETIARNYKNTTTISNDISIAFTRQIVLARYQDYLGQQTPALIYDARDGFHLNALYASAGMVQANGIIAIILPQQNTEFRSTGALKFSFGYLPKKSIFTEKFIQQVLAHNGAYIGSDCMTLPSSRLSPRTKINDHDIAISPNQDFVLSTTQQMIKDDILQTIKRHKLGGTISVILGARGRGKSTLIGDIAYELLSLSQTPANIVVVSALNKGQLHGFYNSFAHNKEAFLLNNSSCKHEAQRDVKYYSTDEIIARAPTNAIVIIDEITSIAPTLSENIIEHFEHCIITGTTSGYEGSGQGFAHRILPVLKNRINTQIYTLSKPFRWLPNDPIETCLDSLLGSALTLPPRSLPKEILVRSNVMTKVIFETLDKSKLLSDTHLYNEIFTLLSEAHYQTTPNDIVRILDSEDCKLVVAYHRHHSCKVLHTSIIAAAVLFEEGGHLLVPLAHDISVGKRRVQGHLTPQTLSMSLLSPALCEVNYLRVNRIAVKNGYTQIGIGSRMLSYCEAYARKQKIDCLSVSFGYTPRLYSFWQKNNYVLAKLGQRIDTSSGCASILMLKPLQIIDELSSSVLRMHLTLQYNYIELTNKRLGSMFKDLILYSRRLEKLNLDAYQKLTRKAVRLYLASEIDLRKLAPLLFFMIKNHRFNHMGQGQNLLNQLHKYHEKGIHKSEKQKIEREVYAAILKTSDTEK